MKPVLRSIVKVLARFIVPRRNEEISPAKVKRILICGQMGIGNMILFTPFLKALRGYFKNSQIVMFVLKSNGADKVLAGSQLVDEIIVWNIDGMSYLQKVKAVVTMVRFKPDLIINRFHSYNAYNVLINILSRAPYRVGHVSSGGWKGNHDYLNNYPVVMSDGEHDIDRYLRLAEKIGISGIDRKTVFDIDHHDDTVAKEFLEMNRVGRGTKFIAVHMGTSLIQRWKQWEIEKWAILTECLLEQGIPVVALGSEDEREMIVDAFSGASSKPIFAVGELTLKQAGAVIRKSRLLVCNDSSLMHIAVAVGTPVVAVYGPNDHKRSAPLGAQHTIIRKDLPCSPCDNFDGAEKVKICPINRRCFESMSPQEVLAVVMKKYDETSHEHEQQEERKGVSIC